LVSHNKLGRFRLLAGFGVLLAFAVIVLGAYTRLSDAGLGCPDWPGCYGHLTVPESDDKVAAANQAWPDRPVEAGKAWKEMVHRYFAGMLGLVILLLAIVSFRNRRDPAQPVLLPTLLVGVVIFQALLGMWTVTLKVMPLVVMGHLVGGFMTLSLLWLLFISTRSWAMTPGQGGGLAWLGVIGLFLLVGQIMLGGWTSSNYSALACPDFPTCHGQWWPTMNLAEGFDLWHGTGIDFEFGILDGEARTAIHMMHRIGALIVGTYLLFLGVKVAGGDYAASMRGIALVMLVFLVTQISLGISNVVFGLPLVVAIFHNAVAALLLLSLITLAYLVFLQRQATFNRGGR